MLDPEEFVARCRQAIAQGGAADDIAPLLKLALASQRQEPSRWGRQELLHCEENLLIVDLTLPPFATSAIHDHQTWAAIGVSEGCEVDELFVEEAGALRAAGRHEVNAGEVLVLDERCIHFIANPRAQATRGIHVYGRNLALTTRRMWDPQTCVARPMDFALFEEWERFLRARSERAGAIVAPATAQVA